MVPGKGLADVVTPKVLAASAGIDPKKQQLYSPGKEWQLVFTEAETIDEENCPDLQTDSSSEEETA